jgi:hypothetical protein
MKTDIELCEEIEVFTSNWQIRGPYHEGGDKPWYVLVDDNWLPDGFETKRKALESLLSHLKECSMTTPMTKEALADLRRLASMATPGPWSMEHENIWFSENGYTKHLAYFCQGDDVDDSQDDANTRYVAAADPTTILTLLDALEAKAKCIAELQSRAESAEQTRTLIFIEPERCSCEGYHIDEAYLEPDPEGDCYDRDEVLEALAAACAAAGITLQIKGE